MATTEAPDWRDDIFECLEAADVRQVAYVPDAGHKKLIERAIGDNRMRAISLSTEEEGIALLGGAWLGGDKGVLLLQSSGVGNCINMLSLARNCQFPLVMIVTMRGEWGEFNTWQVPMGSTTRAHLELAGVHTYRCEQPDDVRPTVENAFRFAFNTNAAVAILLSQRLIGAKVFESGSTKEGTPR